jgi:hypothetical protein
VSGVFRFLVRAPGAAAVRQPVDPARLPEEQILRAPPRAGRALQVAARPSARGRGAAVGASKRSFSSHRTHRLATGIA